MTAPLYIQYYTLNYTVLMAVLVYRQYTMKDAVHITIIR